MFKVRHRICNDCKTEFEYLADESEEEKVCPSCLAPDPGRAITAPRVSIGGSESDFRPHFDYQLGRHYNSYAEKQAHLRELGKVQTGGFASPRDTHKMERKGRPEMTRTQFEAWRAARRAKARKKNEAHIRPQAEKRFKEQENKKIVVPVHKPN